MLTEERKNMILKAVEKSGSVTISELMDKLNASESTIRRDLQQLDKKGLLTRVHGGAISNSREFTIVSSDISVSVRNDLNHDAKLIIGKYAASLIEEGDCIFIDAGTTTGMMIDYITAKDVTFITNAVAHARQLASYGYKVFLPGGLLKSNTEAIVGSDTFEYIQSCNFSKGFFGTNGVTLSSGFSTPDPMEAKIKEKAFNNSRERFILADTSKFGVVSAMTFAQFDDAVIITNDDDVNVYNERANVISVSE